MTLNLASFALGGLVVLGAELLGLIVIALSTVIGRKGPPVVKP